MKTHKSKAKKEDRLRYRQIILCKPGLYYVPFSMQHSHYWKNVICKNCLKMR